MMLFWVGLLSLLSCNGLRPLTSQNKRVALHLPAVSKRYNELIEYLRDDTPKVRPSVKQLDTNSEDFRVIETMVKVADWRKADDITVLNLIGLSEFTNFMMIMEATSKPQNQAISAALEVRKFPILFL